jgi:hypothetical protein
MMEKGLAMRKVLVSCGIISAVLYVAMNVVAALLWDGYSSAAQTVSELSAIDAPTRQLWILLAVPYSLLVIAFGWGIRASGARIHRLRIVGALVIADGAIGLAWPLAPMHLRGAVFTRTDTMHIAFALVTILLMFAVLAIGAGAFGRRFRLYSIATMAILLACGALTGAAAPRLVANLPTPWLGVWERIDIGVFLMWKVVLAIVLLRVPDHRTTAHEAQRPVSNCARA